MVITWSMIIFFIGIATTIGLLVLQNYQSNKRDETRQGDMSKLANALGQYHDQYGTFPTGEGASTDKVWGQPVNSESGNPLQVLVAEGFIDKLPTDPINKNNGCRCGGGYKYYYCYYEEGSERSCIRDGDSKDSFNTDKFHLSTCLENTDTECQITCGGIISAFGNYCPVDKS